MNQTEISKIANSDFQTFKEFVMQPTPEYESKESYDYNKVLAKRYPFLIPVHVWTGKINSEDSAPYDYRFVQGFLGSRKHNGWKELFLNYCEHIKPEFDRLIEETRKKIGSDKKGTPSIEELDELRKEHLPYITDYKEKYGEMSIYWTSETDQMAIDTNIVAMLSVVTCNVCGKISRNSAGKYVAWKTKGWIAYLCKDCFKLNQLQNFRYKADIHKAMLKDYIRECRIEHAKYFILSHHYNDKHTRTYFADDGNGWLKVVKEEIIRRKD